MNLSHFVQKYHPALLFISEPQLFQCDTRLALAPLLPTYCHHLNSEDKYYPELALEKRHAHGGTLALWHSALDPFITTLPTTSPAVLPLLLSVPGLSPSIHVGIYLPTSGRDELFVLALAALTAVLQSALEEHHSVPIYVRGDANVNPSNIPRSHLFSNFLTQFNLKNLPLHHPTHHHFVGNGDSDSQLDVLLFLGAPRQAEYLLGVVCGKENPLISSHHDMVISTFPFVSTSSRYLALSATLALDLHPSSSAILSILAFSFASALDHALALSMALSSLFALASVASLALSEFSLILASDLALS